MSRMLRQLLLCLACLCLTLLPATTTAADHRNVLLVCVDDLRPVMGCYGGAAKTPNIDKFAESAAVFTRHYNQWPVCGPSRASMLGGLRPDSTGIYEIGDSWKISKRPATHPTMPRHFRDNGYKTLSFGKVYHGKAIGKRYGWSEAPWKLDWTCYVDFEYAAGNKQQWRPAYEIYDGPDSRHNDFQTAEKVIQALEVNKDRPFFIAAGFYKPHLPFVAPKRYWDLYSVDEIRLIEPTSLPQSAADFMYNWSEISSYGDPDGKLFSGDGDVGEEQALSMIHAYYACVSFIDAQVGRILKALEQNGLADDTAVVIWSDHGFQVERIVMEQQPVAKSQFLSRTDRHSARRFPCERLATERVRRNKSVVAGMHPTGAKVLGMAHQRHSHLPVVDHSAVVAPRGPLAPNALSVLAALRVTHRPAVINGDGRGNPKGQAHLLLVAEVEVTIRRER